MTSPQLSDEANKKRTSPEALRMLSFAVDERIEIARLLTEARYLVSNESAANFDRFESRVSDDDWDVIFIDGRTQFESVARARELTEKFAPEVPTFALVESLQKNQADLMELGFADLFTPDDLQRLPGVVTRELEARDARKLALEARLLQDQVKSAVDERSILSAIGQLVSSSLDIGQVYDQFVEQVKLLIPLETAAIAVANVEDDSITIEYLSGRELPGFEQGQVMSMSGFTTASQLARFVLVLDSGTLHQMKPEFPGIAELVDAGVGSIMATPLIHRDEVVGFLATATPLADAYGPEHVDIAERIASQISGALANTRLHASIKRIATTRETLAQLGREAVEARDASDLYQSVFSNVKKLLQIDRGAIALTGQDNNSLVIEFVDGLEIEELGIGDVIELTDSSVAVLTKSNLRAVDNARDQERFDPTEGRVASAGLLSSMRVPLRARDSVIGLIAVSASHERAYSARDLSLLEQIADQIAPVIESLSLLERVQGLAVAVETMVDLVAITDLRGVTKYMNPAGVRMLGLDPGKSGVGVALDDFVSAEVAEAIRKTGLAQDADGGGWQTEISVTPRSSSESIPVELLLVPVRNSEGVLTAANVFMRDLRERMAQQVEHREFVSTVSHELRTPLASMKMYTDMLGEGDAGELNDQQRQLVDNLKTTVDRLTRMVDDLNVVSLLEAGRFDLQSETFEMSDLIVSAIDISKPIFADRETNIRFAQPDEPILVNADRERMLQVMVNLLNNAAKYAEAGTETTVAIVSADDEVRVEVADNGPGISSEDMGAVFESFYRSKNARVSRVPGSGLGLSIARGLVEAQGGKIWVESTEGEGSTFIFTLPTSPT